MEKKFIKKIVAVLAAVAMVAGLISIMPAEKAEAASVVNITVSGAYAETLAGGKEGSLYLHMWGGCKQTSWPGTTMTNNGDGTWSVNGIVATSSINVILNNGNIQTCNIENLSIDKQDIYIDITENTEFKISYGDVAASTKELNYYVAGQEGLCGVNWDVTANQMYVNSDRQWIKVFKNVKPATYEFKIVENASWDNPSYDHNGVSTGGNASVTVESTDANVIITFDGSKAGSIVEENVSSYTYNVAGVKELCGIEWDPAENQMTKNDDGTWTKEFKDIAAGEYDFKVVPNGVWGSYAYDLTGITFNTNGRVVVPNDAERVLFIFDGNKVSVEIKEKQDETTKEEATTEELTTEELTTEEKTTVKEETSTKEEASTEEETTKKAEPSTKEEATTEEETTKKEEISTKEEASTEEETTKKEEPSTKEEASTEEETTAKEEPTTEKTTENETENVTKPSEITKEEGKNSAPETVKKEEIVEPEKVVDTAVEKMEKTDDKTVEVVSPKPQTLTKEIFDTIKSEGKNLTVGVTDADNKLQYSWTFSDKAINNTNMNIDLTITFDAPKKDEISKLTGNKEAAYISFAHHGELPGPATIKTYVGDKYKNGDTVYLYYFDEEANKVLMVGDKPLTVKGGYVEYTITHCSTYFLMGEKLAGVAKDVNSLDDANVNVAETETESKANTDTGNTAKPGDNSNVVMWCALLCVMVGIVVFSRKKQLIEE